MKIYKYKFSQRISLFFLFLIWNSYFIYQKLNNLLWLYINYRKFNKFIIKNHYSLSLIKEFLNKFNNIIYFTKFNIHDEFNWLYIIIKNEWKIIFRYHYKLFEYIIMFFELYNIFDIFQHYINDIFHDFLNEFLVIYLDNLFIYFKILKKYK